MNNVLVLVWLIGSWFLLGKTWEELKSLSDSDDKDREYTVAWRFLFGLLLVVPLTIIFLVRALFLK